MMIFLGFVFRNYGKCGYKRYIQSAFFFSTIIDLPLRKIIKRYLES